MHFTSSNLLHDFPNGKYMLFYLLKNNFLKNHVKSTGQSDLTRNPIDPNPFLIRLKWPVFDPQPNWLDLNLTRPARFAMSTCVQLIFFTPVFCVPWMIQICIKHSYVHLLFPASIYFVNLSIYTSRFWE